MFERRPILGILIGLTLCTTIWRISIQEAPFYATEYGYGNQISLEDRRPLPTSYAANHPVPTVPHQSKQLHQNNLNYERYNVEGHKVPFTTETNKIPFDDRRPLLTSYPVTHPIPTDPHQSNQHHQNNLNYERFNLEGQKVPFTTESNNWVSTNNSSINNSEPITGSQFNPMYEYESLPPNDYSSLVDLKSFRFLINQRPCLPRNIVHFLILVHSAPGNLEKRQIIRETWGSLRNKHIRLLFLVGSVVRSELQQRLDNESSTFSDLIQGNFIDNYRNMTYKHVMALKWFTYYCPEAKFLIKTDDDVFVNTIQLLEYVDLHQQPLQSPPRTYQLPPSGNNNTNSNTFTPDSLSHNTSHILNILQSRNFLFCQRQEGARVKRSYRSKWRVSRREFSGRYYPPYCPGYSIMYSPDVVFRLYNDAQQIKYFWIDDVHITGTLAQRAGINITSFLPWVINSDIYMNFLNGKTDISRYVFLFGWPNISGYQIRVLWDLTYTNFISTRYNATARFKHDFSR